MKKVLSLFLILLSFTGGMLFADSNDDPFDKLAEKLIKDIDDDSKIAVKVFKSELSKNERTRISKSVQYALYCFDDIEVVADADDADYICSGKIEVDGPNYIITAKIVDNYDDTVIAKAKQKVPKKYYATEEIKTETVIVENDVDAEDVLGLVIAGAVVGGTIHALTTPHHVRPHKRPRPAPRPIKPHRP